MYQPTRVPVCATKQEYVLSLAQVSLSIMGILLLNQPLFGIRHVA